MGTGPVTKNNIVKREIKIFIIGLQKNNPEIIPDPSVKYLRKCNFPQQHVFFLPVSYIIYMQKTLCVAYWNLHLTRRLGAHFTIIDHTMDF